jgi:integrase
MSSVTRDHSGAEGLSRPAGPGPVPFARFRAEVLSLYEPPLRAQATYRRMRQMFDIVSALMPPDATTEDLTPPLVAKLVASRPPGQSPYTTHAIVSSLRVACGYAASRQGYLFSNPFDFRRRWVRLPAPSARQRHHSLEDIARVLQLARDDVARNRPGSWSHWSSRRLLALVSLVAYTGLRKSEALHLRVEDLDLRGRMLLVRPRVGNRLKTEASAQPVPMPDALVGVLAEWLPYLSIPDDMANGPERFNPRGNPRGLPDAGWLFPNSYRTGPWIGGSPGRDPLDRVKALGKRAGVEDFTFLSLRHSWATHAESAWGFSEEFIRRVLRHTNSRTQAHYRHADAPNLKAAVKGIGFGGEPATAPEPLELPAPEALPGPVARPGRRVLDPDDVAELRELRARGWSYAALMARYGAAKGTLHAAIHGQTHRNVPMPPADDAEGL